MASTGGGSSSSLISTSQSPVDRLQALEIVEKEIHTCLTSAGQALQELSKDKPVGKQMDLHTSTFLKTLNHVEMEIAKHINYLIQVSTGQAHEGSSYATQKVLQMAWHRTEHARSRVVELQRMKNAMIQRQNEAQASAQQQQQDKSTGSTSNAPASSSSVVASLPSSSSSELVSSSSSLSKPVPIVRENP